MRQKTETYEEECLCSEGQWTGTVMKRPYEALSIQAVTSIPVCPILAASIVSNSKIESVGQELGFTYTLDSESGIDTNTGKTFSHEWETGTN